MMSPLSRPSGRMEMGKALPPDQSYNGFGVENNNDIEDNGGVADAKRLIRGDN
jgi:hypothetical protein